MSAAPLSVPEARVVAILDKLTRMVELLNDTHPTMREAIGMRKQLELLQRDLYAIEHRRRESDKTLMENVELGAPAPSLVELTFRRSGVGA